MSELFKKSKLPLENFQGTDSEMLLQLQKETFNYFLKEINPINGLIADRSEKDSPGSLASVGMGLSCYIAGVERQFISREEAIDKTLTILNFFYYSHQGPEPDATGYKGFYYHYLDMKTGKRTGESELSTIDTALFLAGALSTQSYYTKENEKENEIRQLVDKIYKRVDWKWALNGSKSLSHGWNPEHGFLKCFWSSGYSEAHILYILALGSPTFPIEELCYSEWISTFEWKNTYGIEYLYAGPLFIHQLSQIWIDFRTIQDDFCSSYLINYFENSRRAIAIQQKYAIENPHGFKGYGINNWGISASNGPGPISLKIDGILREFYGYKARGVPFGPDDGTIAPWAVVASLPFSPEIVLKTIRYEIEQLDLKKHNKYGFEASFNSTYPEKTNNLSGWVSPWQLGLNQGPVVLMIENYQSELMWNLMKKCPYIISGLLHAGFRGGWLSDSS